MSKEQPHPGNTDDTADDEQPHEALLPHAVGRLVRAALIALVAVTVALLSIHALNSYDIWTHLACGRLIWEERCIPDHEPFSYTQNREMTLEEARPQLAVRETVLDRTNQLVVAGGTPFDEGCKAKLRKAGVPLRSVRLKIEPPLRRLTADAVDRDGNVVLKKGTLLEEQEIERLHEAGIGKVRVTVPWVNHEWLFQILAYLSYKWWGLAGPIFYKTAILLAAYLFVLLTVYRRETHVVGIAAVFLAAITSYKRFYMRPEVFSILFTALWIYLLERYRHRRPSWSICITMPLLMVVWINAHGYFILGPAVMVIYLIGEGVQSLIPEPRTSRQVVRRFFTRTLLWRENVIRGKAWGILAVATLLTAAATFVNPYGINGARYPIDVLAQVADPTSVIRTIIGEMQPPFNFSYTYAVTYTWALIWLSGLSWVLNIRRLRFSRLIFYVVSIMFLSKALRNMPFFGVPGAVFLALNVNEAWPETVRFLRQRVIPEALLVAKWASQTGLAALLVFFCVWIVSDRFYVYDVAGIRYGLGYTRQKFSMGAVEFVRDNPVKGNLFNSFGMGGLCMWKLYPEERPGPDGKPRLYYGGRRLFIDGRAELYGGPFVKKYNSSMSKEKLWKEFDDKFNFQIVFVNWQASDTRPLMARLYRDPEWALCYGDGVGYVYVRNTPENRAIITRARRHIEKPRFVDFAELYASPARCLPGVPSRRAFVACQDRIWSFAKIMSPDPRLADEARRVSDSPDQVRFDRRCMTNTYDRLRESVPLLPRRLISPGQMVGRAGFAMRNGFPELADAFLAGLIQLTPESPVFYMQRGTVYQGWGETWLRDNAQDKAMASLRMALEYYREVEKRNPSYPGLTLQFLRVAYKMNDGRLTTHYLRRARRDVYPSISSTMLIANVCMTHKMYREALRQYGMVLRMIPERDTSFIHERIGFCHLGLRDVHKALYHVNKAIRLNEENIGAWFTLGLIYRGMGRRDEATQALKKCLELKPDFKAARDLIERLKHPPEAPRRSPLPKIP